MNPSRDHRDRAGYEAEIMRRSAAAPVDGAVFYSGRGPLAHQDNRQIAREYCAAQPPGRAAVLEDTPLGRYLASQSLDPAIEASSPLTREDAASLYRSAAIRFAAEARGRATCFVDGARDQHVFRSSELPALLGNEGVSHVNDIPREKLLETHREHPGLAWRAIEDSARRLGTSRSATLRAQETIPVARPLSREAAGAAPPRKEGHERERSR
ncbi:MAG: hypothetical protein HYV96_15155 [Opitutae bacterium]|nr:hypothetical protein [Opitutae bacterium]